MHIIDACALINILNCQLSTAAIGQFKGDICIQGLVEDECESVRGELESLIDKGLIFRFDGAYITGSEVASMATAYAIGIGESECLAIAKKYEFNFISDDRRARNAAMKAIPTAVITGSIGMLCGLLDANAITCEDADRALLDIRNAGGHIPKFNFTTRSLY